MVQHGSKFFQRGPSYFIFVYVSSENKRQLIRSCFSKSSPHKNNKYWAIPYTFQLTTSKDNEIWIDFWSMTHHLPQKIDRLI